MGIAYPATDCDLLARRKQDKTFVDIGCDSNMKKISLALLSSTFVALVAGEAVDARNIPWRIDYNPGNGHKYFISPSNSFSGPQLSGWHAAEYAATQSSARLVTISDAAEQNWLVQNFGGDELFWIGLNDASREGDFRWVSNNSTIPSYRNWFPGEPNNAFGFEDFVVMNWHRPGKWNDLKGFGTYASINANSIQGIAEFSGLPITRTEPRASLLFQDIGNKRIPGLDHVGLFFDGYVYESTPAQKQGLYNNPETGRYEPVDDIQGVQKERSRGVFKAYPNSRNKEISISQNLAGRMARLINGKVRDAGYQDLDLRGMIEGNFSPFKQKGWNNKFTCVGLIEWAAEQSGYRGGQGFIPTKQEFIKIGPISIPTITPEIMYWAVKNPNSFFSPGNYLHGLLDPVDFILTDSLGRRLGYTAELGLLNEIPGAFYTGDDWAEQFYIPNLPSGNYTLDLFGLDDEANVAIGNAEIGTLFSGFLKRGETHTISFILPDSQVSYTPYPEEDWVMGYDPEGNWIDRSPESYAEDDWSEWDVEPQSVPEPSFVLGILVLGSFCVSSRLKYKKQQ